MDHSEVKHLPKVDHSPADLDATAKTILMAASLIEERGWCQGEYSRNGRLCMLGAIRVAEGSDDDASGAVARLRASMNVKFPHEWNDDPKRTKEEVVAKLRAVALSGGN